VSGYYTFFDIERALGGLTVAEILHAPDGAAQCKARAIEAFSNDDPRVHAWTAFRKMLEGGHHRLTDGTIARVGLRVARVDEDDRWDFWVVVITSVHFLEHGTVGCGPQQFSVSQLCAAPASPTAHVDLEDAARWVDKIQGDHGAPLAKLLRDEALALRGES
jgi:hypothetical protein